MSQPARIGPATPARPMTGPNGMNALPSSSGGNATFTRAESLRDHHGAEQTLQHPRDDEPARARREAAGE